MTPMAGTLGWLRHGFCGHALGHESLDHIARLDVVIVGERNAALEARLHFTGVVLEALERLDLARVDQHVVAQQPHLVIAPDDAVVHVTARDAADLGYPEYVAHLRAA